MKLRGKAQWLLQAYHKRKYIFLVESQWLIWLWACEPGKLSRCPKIFFILAGGSMSPANILSLMVTSTRRCTGSWLHSLDLFIYYEVNISSVFCDTWCMSSEDILTRNETYFCVLVYGFTIKYRNYWTLFRNNWWDQVYNENSNSNFWHFHYNAIIN